jgi:hypothetical protein
MIAEVNQAEQRDQAIEEEDVTDTVGSDHDLGHH